MAPIPPIVSSSEMVTLVGGGKASLQDMHKSLTLAPRCVAADGGAALALQAGAEIAAVIGDFDSLSAETLAAIPPERQHRVAEQESTDFEKALGRIEAPLVLGVGFLGRRMDHALAVFRSLAVLAERPCLLLGQEEIICLAPPEIDLPCRAGDVVSLFPLAEVTGESRGLEWPLAGLRFHPTGQIGTSNRAQGPVHLRFSSPDMLLILPRYLFEPVALRLADPAAARWPAR